MPARPARTSTASSLEPHDPRRTGDDRGGSAQAVFQTGEQRARTPQRKAVELIRNGRIGKIQSIIGYNYPAAYECNFPAQPIPSWLDWDAWCGPNEVVPFHTDLYLSRIPYEREKPYPTQPAEAYAVGPGWM